MLKLRCNLQLGLSWQDCRKTFVCGRTVAKQWLANKVSQDYCLRQNCPKTVVCGKIVPILWVVQNCCLRQPCCWFVACGKIFLKFNACIISQKTILPQCKLLPLAIVALLLKCTKAQSRGVKLFCFIVNYWHLLNMYLIGSHYTSLHGNWHAAAYRCSWDI